MHLKSLFKELQWIAGILICLILIGMVVLGKEEIFAGQIDIQLHDTYFVFNYWNLLVPVFLLVALIIYVVKEGIHHFNRILPNFFLLLLLLAIMLLFALQVWYPFQAGPVTYPALDAAASSADTVEEVVGLGMSACLAIELLLGIGFGLLAMKTRKLIVSKKYIG